MQSIMEAKPATFINISVLREPPAARRGATASPKHVLRNFLGLHNGANRRTIFEASGHESRCASEGTGRKTHQCLRSTRAMLSRQSRYQADRSESRREYRKWIQDALEDGKFTLVHPQAPSEKGNE